MVWSLLQWVSGDLAGHCPLLDNRAVVLGETLWAWWPIPAAGLSAPAPHPRSGSLLKRLGCCCLSPYLDLFPW